MTKTESYSAASVFPAKLLHKKVIKRRKIVPVHLQLLPTNHCNLNCKFCSCGDRRKSLELRFDDIKEVLDICAGRGTKAITITGGGEPLLHPQINEIIDYTGLEVGLVSNGILLDKLKHHANMIWCRISSADDRTPAYKAIERALKVNPKTDWAVSHVVTRTPNYEVINGVVEFANRHDFTHVRLVSDLFDLDNVPDMDEVKRNVTVPDERVIYQGRKDSTRGTRNCYISLLKPIVSPEGVFPCCGSQYAIKGQARDMVEKMKMGDVKDLAKIFDEQRYFDGSVCDVCYYQQYNDALAKLKEKPKHLNFV